MAVHGVCGFWSPLAVGLFAAGYPTGLNNVDTSLTGQLYGMMVFLPLGFFGGYIPSWILKKFNLLRVPPEVELEGLDMAEYQTDFYPEFGRPPEVIVLPDGTRGRGRSDPARGIQGDDGERSPRVRPAPESGVADGARLQHRRHVLVVGTLVGWAVRADRRRRAESPGRERGRGRRMG